MLIKTLPPIGNQTAYTDTEVNGGVTRPYPMASHYSWADSRQEHHTAFYMVMGAMGRVQQKRRKGGKRKKGFVLYMKSECLIKVRDITVTAILKDSS